LVPVIGLLQVGVQARADRYMYVPMVGMGVMLAWGGADIVRSRPPLKRWVSALAAAALLALAPVTWQELRYWKNCETLFRHAIAVTTRNGEAYLLLGNWLSSIPSRRADTIAVFEAGVRAIPDEERLHTSLGAVLLSSGVPANLPIAVDHFRTALRIDPNYVTAHNSLSSALSITGHPAEAMEEAKASLLIDPDDADAHYMLGFALSKSPGRSEEAIEQFREALKVRPDFTEAHNDLGLALTKVPGDAFEALFELEEALRINPDYRPAHINLGLALAQVPGRLPEAITHIKTALKLRPEPSLQETLDKLEARQRQGQP
jgi:tetratricopeptide (TPR) repeat protein